MTQAEKTTYEPLEPLFEKAVKAAEDERRFVEMGGASDNTAALAGFVSALKERFPYLVRENDRRMALPAAERAREAVQSARGALERDYMDDVDGIADDLVDRLKAGDFGDGERAREGFDEALWETIDGSQRVIYTAKAQECLLVSRNDGAAFEEGLVDGSEFKDGIEWSKLAFAALRADVIEELTSRGIDVNDPARVECGECGTKFARSEVADGDDAQHPACPDCREDGDK